MGFFVQFLFDPPYFFVRLLALLNVVVAATISSTSSWRRCHSLSSSSRVNQSESQKLPFWSRRRIRLDRGINFGLNTNRLSKDQTSKTNRKLKRKEAKAEADPFSPLINILLIISSQL